MLKPAALISCNYIWQSEARRRGQQLTDAFITALYYSGEFSGFILPNKNLLASCREDRRALGEMHAYFIYFPALPFEVGDTIMERYHLH